MHDATVKALEEHRTRLFYEQKRLEKEDADNAKHASSIATAIARVTDSLAGVDQDLVAAGIDPETPLPDDFHA